MDNWIVQAMAEMFAINAEIQAMVALNQYRMSRDETIAYSEEAFEEKAHQLWSIANLIQRSK